MTQRNRERKREKKKKRSVNRTETPRDDIQAGRQTEKQADTEVETYRKRMSSSEIYICGSLQFFKRETIQKRIF